jgi:hypothetical protein
VAGAALGDHQGPDRLHRPVAAFGHAGCSPGQGGARGADRVQRVGLSLAVPFLPVSAVDFHDPDPGRSEVTGQSGAVAAGALDADQGDVPELPQPAQQAGVPGRGRGELPRPQQPADGIERRGDVHLGMGVHAAGNRGSFFYDGHCRPFLG